MAGPREITLDFLFTPKFFDLKEESVGRKLSFPLPETPADLRHFLKYQRENEDEVRARQLERSKQFKEGFANIVDALRAWCAENGIEPSPCDRFKRNYLDYLGTDDKKNELDFRLYNDGITRLAVIVEELKNADTPLDERKTIASNLLQGLNVCGPGSYTNIVDAHLDLVALSNASIYWMKLRRTVAEQVISELLKNTSALQGMHIHYVNGVINRYGDALSIKMIEDGYVANCDPVILDSLFEQFSQVFPAKFTLEQLIDLVSHAAPLINLAPRLESVTPVVYAANEREIMRFMAQRGSEAPDKRFFKGTSDIVKLYGEYDDKVAVDWQAPYKLYLSIYSRMSQAGLINLAEQESMLTLNHKTKLWYLKGRSLRFAYVQEEQGEQVRTIPFIGYCVEKWASNEASQEEKEALIACLNNEMTDANRAEVLVGVMQYLGSTLVKEMRLDVKECLKYVNKLISKDNESKEWKEFYNVIMKSLLMKSLLESEFITAVIEVFNELPVDKHVLFVSSFKDRYGVRLRELLNKLPASKREQFFTVLKDTLKNVFDLVTVLRALPDDEFLAFAVSNVKAIQGGMEFSYMLIQLPFFERMRFVRLVGNSLPEIIQNYDQLEEVLKELKPSRPERMEFFTLLKEQLPKIILNASQLALLVRHLDEFEGLQLIVWMKDRLPEIIQNGDQLASVLRSLRYKDQVPFLALFKSHLDQVIRNEDELARVLEVMIDFTDEAYYLKKYVERIVQDVPQLISLMSKLSEYKKYIYLAFFQDHVIAIMQGSGPDHSEYLCRDKMTAILNELPESQRIQYAVSLLTGALNKLPYSKRTLFIKGCMGSHFIKDKLGEFFYELKKPERESLVESLGQNIIDIIPNGYLLEEILRELLLDDRKHFIACLDEQIAKIVKDESELEKVLLALKPPERPSVTASFLTRAFKLLPLDKCVPFAKFVNQNGALLGLLELMLKEKPKEQQPEFMGNLFSCLLTIKVDINSILDRFDSQRQLADDEMKTTIRRTVLKRLCESDDIEVLKKAYKHPFFSELKKHAKAGGVVNAVGGLFVNTDLVETYSQKEIQKRIDVLIERKADKRI